jgi:hypothetical protein
LNSRVISLGLIKDRVDKLKISPPVISARPLIFPNVAQRQHFWSALNLLAMAVCVRCGAETDVLVYGLAPLCAACHEELEREATQALMVMYLEALRRCREDLSNLANAVAAGPLESDEFLKVLRQCEKSQLICMELLCELANRESPGFSARWRRYWKSTE